MSGKKWQDMERNGEKQNNAAIIREKRQDMSGKI